LALIKNSKLGHGFFENRTGWSKSLFGKTFKSFFGSLVSDNENMSYELSVKLNPIIIMRLGVRFGFRCWQMGLGQWWWSAFSGKQFEFDSFRLLLWW
jgi:hypothetical protein